jgi:type III secretion protein J
VVNEGLGRAQRCALIYFLFVAAGCDARLSGDLAEAQANAMVVALHEHGIGAAKEREGGGTAEPRFAVEVAEGEVARALAVLAAADLPHRNDPGIEETFGEGGLVPTATEERARFVAALGGELAQTIERIDGVVDARVHVALPETQDLLLDETAPSPRASVLIKYRVDHAPPEPEALRALVAGAVQGMDPAEVSILAVPSESTGAAPAPLVALGPITVTAGSAGALKAILAGSLVLHVLLALVLVAVLRRTRRPRRARSFGHAPPA